MASHIYFFDSLAKIKVDSYDSLSIEKTVTLRNVIMLIKWVLNKDKNTTIRSFQKITRIN